MLRKACGSTTRRRVLTNVMPIDRDASACPDATELTPERTASATKEAVYTVKAISENRKNVDPTPTFGNPKTDRKKTTVSGVLRTTSTYPVATQRSGGAGDTRMAAMRVPRTSAPIAASSVSVMVVMKPSTNTSRLSRTASTDQRLPSGSASEGGYLSQPRGARAVSFSP